MKLEHLTISQFQNFTQLESDVYSDEETNLSEKLKININTLSDEKRDSFNDDIRELAKEKLKELWEEQAEHLSKDELNELSQIWGI